MAKVFLSSVVTGFEEFRDAAADGIESLGHHVVRSEQFGVRADSPQRACLNELRATDCVVLVLGTRYGSVNPGSALSATHEEFLEAASAKPLLVFIQSGVNAEEAQVGLIKEAQDWAHGGLTGSFATPDELRRLVTKALHQWEVAQSAGDANQAEMIERGRQLLPETGSGPAKLTVVAVPGPQQELAGPALLASSEFRQQLLRLAQKQSLFDSFERTIVTVDHDSLLMEQPASVLRLHASGACAITQQACYPQPKADRGIATLVEEDLQHRIGQATITLADVLDLVDLTHRGQKVLVFAALVDGAWVPWKTMTEFQASPNSATMGRAGDLVEVLPAGQPMPRPALRNRADNIAEDVTVRLRQEVYQS